MPTKQGSFGVWQSGPGHNIDRLFPTLPKQTWGHFDAAKTNVEFEICFFKSCGRHLAFYPLKCELIMKHQNIQRHADIAFFISLSQFRARNWFCGKLWVASITCPSQHIWALKTFVLFLLYLELKTPRNLSTIGLGLNEALIYCLDEVTYEFHILIRALTKERQSRIQSAALLCMQCEILHAVSNIMNHAYSKKCTMR